MAGPATSDGLLRWLLGGLAAGGILFGLLVAAHEIGYGRGQSAKVAAPATTAPAPPARTETTAKPASPAELAAEGERLFSELGCAACHSLTGAAGAGPTVKGLAGSSVTLADGTTVTAGDAYLAESITDADAQVVEGYSAGVMSASTASLDLTAGQVDALVAFMKSKR